MARSGVSAAEGAVDSSGTSVGIRIHLRVRCIAIRSSRRRGSVGCRWSSAVVRVLGIFAAVRSSVSHVRPRLGVAGCVVGRRRAAVASIGVNRRAIRRRRLAVGLVVRLLPVRRLLVGVRIHMRRSRCWVSIRIASDWGTITAAVGSLVLVTSKARLLRVVLSLGLGGVAVLSSHWKLLLWGYWSIVESRRSVSATGISHLRLMLRQKRSILRLGVEVARSRRRGGHAAAASAPDAVVVAAVIAAEMGDVVLTIVQIL